MSAQPEDHRAAGMVRGRQWRAKIQQHTVDLCRWDQRFMALLRSEGIIDSNNQVIPIEQRGEWQ